MEEQINQQTRINRAAVSHADVLNDQNRELQALVDALKKKGAAANKENVKRMLSGGRNEAIANNQDMIRLNAQNSQKLSTLEKENRNLKNIVKTYGSMVLHEHNYA